jgi:hypothetical protein
MLDRTNRHVHLSGRGVEYLDVVALSAELCGDGIIHGIHNEVGDVVGGRASECSHLLASGRVVDDQRVQPVIRHFVIIICGGVCAVNEIIMIISDSDGDDFVIIATEYCVARQVPEPSALRLDGKLFLLPYTLLRYSCASNPPNNVRNKRLQDL